MISRVGAGGAGAAGRLSVSLDSTNDATLCHMLGVPGMRELANAAMQADEEIHRALRMYGVDLDNVCFLGCLLDALEQVRDQGELRGRAFERSMMAGLWRK